MIGKITRKQWEKMSPAMQAMWVMQQGAEPEFPNDQPNTARANRMQEATDDFVNTIKKVNEMT